MMACNRTHDLIISLFKIINNTVIRLEGYVIDFWREKQPSKSYFTCRGKLVTWRLKLSVVFKLPVCLPFSQYNFIDWAAYRRNWLICISCTKKRMEIRFWFVGCMKGPSMSGVENDCYVPPEPHGSVVTLDAEPWSGGGCFKTEVAEQTGTSGRKVFRTLLVLREKA